MRILCVDDHVVLLAGLTAIIEHQSDIEVVDATSDQKLSNNIDDN